MARSASALAFKSEFDAFLMATIGADSSDSGMQLSVLSALARSGVDPWEEAAGLSRLPSDTATRKLTSLIAALPRGPSMRLDAETTAARLIPLLPQRDVSHVQPRASLPKADAVGQAWRFKSAMIYGVCMFWILMNQWFMANHAPVAPSEKPAAPVNGAVAPQTPPQSSGPLKIDGSIAGAERTQRGGVEESVAADTYPH